MLKCKNVSLLQFGLWESLRRPPCCRPSMHKRGFDVFCMIFWMFWCFHWAVYLICVGFFKPCLTDLVQPAQRWSAGALKEEADHTAAARHRIFNCADKQRQHSWRPAATGVRPHRPWPNQHQAHHLSAPRWQDDNQSDQVPEYSTRKVSANKHAVDHTGKRSPWVGVDQE